MTNEQKRKYLIDILIKLNECSIYLITYLRFFASDSKSKRICTKSINKCKKAIEILPSTKHVEILESLYNTLITGKENVFVLGGALISSKKFNYWDKTEKGFKEFVALENEAREKSRVQAEEQKKKRETIEKAQKEGKKVEMVFDPTTKKVSPMIVEDKPTD